MSEHSDTTKPLLTSGQYDTIRNTAQRVIPAIGTFYATVALLWGLPYTAQVVGTCTALVLLLGIVMSVSKASFQKAGGDGTIGEDGIVSLNSSAVLDKDVVVLTKDASQL